MKNIRILLILMIFISSTLIFIFSNNKLVYEWGDIVDSLLSGKGYTYLNRPSAYMPPLYPMCLTLFIYMFGGIGVKLLHTILFIGSYFIFIKILQSVERITFSKSAKISIGHIFIPFLFFLYPPVLFGYLNVSIFPLSTLLFLSFVYILAQILLELKISYFVFLGIISGLLTLSRSEFLYLGPFILVFYFYFMKLNFSVSLGRKYLIFLFSFILVVTPWIVRNKIELGHAVLSTAKYYNLWRGNNGNQSTIPITPEEKFSNIDFYHTYSEVEQESFLKKHFDNYIVNNKGEFIIGVIKKLRNFYFSYYPNSVYHGDFAQYLFVPWVAVLFLVIYNIVRFRKEILNPFNKVILFIFIIYGFVHGLTQVLPRYNLQFLIVFIVVLYSSYIVKIKKNVK